MKSTNERAMRRLATATTLSRELTANAWDVAVMEVRVRVKRKMKNLEASTVKPEKQNRHYSWSLVIEFDSTQGDHNLMHFHGDYGQYHNLIKIQSPQRQVVAGSAFPSPLRLYTLHLQARSKIASSPGPSLRRRRAWYPLHAHASIGP